VLVFLRHFPGQTLVGVYNMTPADQSLPRWVVPVGNWAWDALTEETPLTDGPLRLGTYQTRWFVQQA
jgi:amylosucrase